MKHRLITIAIIILAICSHAFAQSKSMVSITVGPSVPIGQFAEKDKNSVVAFGNFGNNFTGAGFAKVGYNLCADYQYKLRKNFGLVLKLKWQQNSINSDVIKDNLLSNSTWATAGSVTNSKYNSGSALIGAYWYIPIKSAQNKFDVQLKLLAGALKTSIPSKSYYLTNSQTFMIAVGNNSAVPLSIGFSFLGSAGLAYHLNNRFNLLANLEYSDAFLSSPTYYKTLLVNGTLLSSDSYKVKINPSTINLNVGIGYKF